MKQPRSATIICLLVTIYSGGFPCVSSSITNNAKQIDLNEVEVNNPTTEHLRSLGSISLHEVRTFDGTDNHWDNVGAVGSVVLRLSGIDYPSSNPTGEFKDFRDGPNPREISNIVINQKGAEIPSSAGMTDAVWAWGQFIDHDISLTDTNPANGEADVPVMGTDDMLHPVIRINRGNHVKIDGVRQPFNQLTSFLDASSVYGSDKERADALRTFSDGQLKTSAGNLMPLNVDGLPNSGSSRDIFVGGDVRVNENVILTSIHTLFVREHNRLAYWLKQKYPFSNDESLFQLARKIVAAEIQKITYEEFLPALLGPYAPSRVQTKYDPDISPSVALEFSTALFRMGHTLLSSEIMVGYELDQQETISLRAAFSNADFIKNKPENIGRLLRGLSVQPCQEMDNMIVEDVRTFLFLPPPNPVGLDLSVLNIQRGREQGLPTYNQVRVGYGLAPVTDFSDISSNLDTQLRLAKAYGTVDKIDAWVGGISEDHLEGANIGQLIAAALVDQFTRLRDGDRFFYTSDPDLDNFWIAKFLQEVTWGKLIRLNTEEKDAPLAMFFMADANK